MSAVECVIIEITWDCLSCGKRHVQWSDSTSAVCSGCGKFWGFVA